MKEVRQQSALDSVREFCARQEKASAGTLVISFPVGDPDEIATIFELFLERKKNRIVAIWCAQRWSISAEKYLVSDMTERLHYTPPHGEEGVYFYRRK
ncbi:MAG: hypothetical protein ACR2PX_05185 [Endozoicomonas sp.]|uniref:hypothetical protein n=1 Tax=Endozoicomonas sp. TaxID=1892382 RepID=UPI003D9BD175